jgi:hypothetical protein
MAEINKKGFENSSDQNNALEAGMGGGLAGRVTGRVCKRAGQNEAQPNFPKSQIFRREKDLGF